MSDIQAQIAAAQARLQQQAEQLAPEGAQVTFEASGDELVINT